MADHFNVCRPESKTSTSFQKLWAFINTFLQEDRRLQIPKENLLKYTVGVEAVVDSMRCMLDSGNRRLAISGMGGIGKTTAAKELIDTIGIDFDYTCFVDDVKGKMKNDKSERSLRQMITEHLMCRGRRVDKDRFDWSMLETKRVLIMLDDVDKKEHVMILNREDQFSKQSCWVTTSRERHPFLEQHGFEFHQMETLHPSDAEKLLFWHASRQKEVPPPAIQKWVKRLAEKCGYLPLALEAVGTRLVNRTDDAELWEGAYEKIQAVKSVGGKREDSFWPVLEWSYDELESDEQDMFLDIATIFHGDALEDVHFVWEAYLSSWKLTWNNLVDKCLVSLEGMDFIGRSFINMHELYRDLGQIKANPEPTNVATHTRVFQEGKIKELLEKEDVAVKVLCYESDLELLSRSSWDLLQCKNLKVVTMYPFDPEDLYHSHDVRVIEMMLPPSVQYANIPLAGTNTFKQVCKLKALRCLILHLKVPMLPHLLSSMFQLPELKHLEINNSSMTQPLPFVPSREVNHYPEAFSLTRLKILRIKECDLLTELPPSLGQLSALSELSISSCKSLAELPASLGQLSALSKLDIHFCKHLAELPASLGQLSALSKLDISHCERLVELPASLGQLSALSELSIFNCTRLAELPTCLGQLSALSKLFISYCECLAELPASLGELSALSELSICYCKCLVELPASLGQLSTLSNLFIKGCYSLTELSEPLRRLQSPK